MPRSPRSLLIAPPLALALALLLPAPAPALAASSPDVERLAGARARAHLAAARPLPSDLSLETQRVYRWAAGAHVHLEQRVRGVPVENHRVIVSLDPALRPRRVRGAPLTRAALDVTPTLAPAEAEARARALLEALLGPPASAEPWPPRHELRVWIDDDGAPRLSWAVDLARRGPGALETFRVLIDAHDGAPLHARPSSRAAQANVYPQNPANSALTEVTLARLTSDAALDGEYATVRSCADWKPQSGGGECLEVTPLATPDPSGDYFFDPDPTSSADPLAEVQMYHHLDKVAHYFDTTFGFAHGAPMEGIVNFELDNAFFGDADGDGKAEVAFGQGDVIDFAYDADVIYHEYVHSVFAGLTNLGFFGADEYGIHFAAGGLNEGTADLFALALTQDPKLGEYAGLGFELDAIRDLEADRTCPEDLHGESHKDGELWGATGWNMIDDPALGPDITAQLIYGAVAGWGVEIGWDSAGDSLLTTAADMLDAAVIDQAQHDAIVDHVAASGMPGCERVISLDDGQPRAQYLTFIGFLPDLDSIPTTAQFRVTAPADASALRLVVEAFEGDPGLGYVVRARKGAFIRHEVESLGILKIPRPADFDLEVTGEGAGFELTIDATSPLALEPGETYYFALAATGAGQSGLLSGEITVSAQVDYPASGETETGGDASSGGETGDAGATGDSGDTSDAGATDGGAANDGADEGCGCASQRGRAPSWLLALVLLGLARRRPR